MKKLFISLSLTLLLAGCSDGSYKAIDTTWSFNKVIIYLPNGDTIKGEVQSWRDYEDCDMIQVTVNDKTYYTHGSNVVLIHE